MPHTAAALSSDPADRFFVKELADEAAPRRETMERLCELAAQLFLRRPWDVLNESELVLVKDPVSAAMCHCSVMGQAGQVFALHAYVGEESFRLFRKLEAGKPVTMGEFLASQRSVSVEFVRIAELTAADRQVFRGLDLALKRGALVPVFRAIRPGYHPWYVTEEEALALAECQRAVITICDLVAANSGASYWSSPDTYPVLSRVDGAGSQPEFRIEATQVKSSPAPPLECPAVDESRLQKIREGQYPRRAVVLEVDHFHGAGMIGDRNQRKACFRMALAVDAQTAFAYPPELSLPSASTGEALANVVLNAIESGRMLPREIRVGNAAYMPVLDPIARALGVSVRVHKSLRALEFTKKHLLEAMGDPGPLPYV
ncbi:MAG: DUF7309 domain-containing protein [Candidatus Acidiferrales bacterium]